MYKSSKKYIRFWTSKKQDLGIVCEHTGKSSRYEALQKKEGNSMRFLVRIYSTYLNYNVLTAENFRPINA